MSKRLVGRSQGSGRRVLGDAAGRDCRSRRSRSSANGPAVVAEFPRRPPRRQPGARHHCPADVSRHCPRLSAGVRGGDRPAGPSHAVGQGRMHRLGGRLDAASVLQASGFRRDVTVFRLNAARAGDSGLESAFRRNAAERVYLFEAAHNPEVAGSNPAPATGKALETGAFLVFCIRRQFEALPNFCLPHDSGAARLADARPTSRGSRL
jgi:hypothetical protein